MCHFALGVIGLFDVPNRYSTYMTVTKTRVLPFCELGGL